MNVHLILLLLSGTLLATMCALFVLGILMVKRHRSLFKMLIDMQRRYDGELERISVQTRKDVRKLAFRLDYPDILPVVPFDSRSQDGEDIFLYDFFRGRR